MQQVVKGIPIYNGVANVNITANNEILSVGNRLQANIAQRINTVKPVLSEIDALNAAISQLKFPLPDKLTIGWRFNPDKNNYEFVFPKYPNQLPIPCKLMFTPITAADQSKSEIRLTWDLAMYQPDGQHWWSVRIDAENGQIVHKIDWVVRCNWQHCEANETACPPMDNTCSTQTHENCEHGHTETDEITTSSETFKQMGEYDYNVYAVPVESPTHGDRQVVNSPWLLAPNASPFGWHDTDGDIDPDYYITRGNNVRARDDQNGDDQGGYSPGDTTLDFNYPVDFSKAPKDNMDPALTNLFYWNNTMHDFCYLFGFDEVSGNFQENNYGKGGIGSDYVNADGLDGSGTNNANFATGPDGENPRMQMFLWGAGGGAVMKITEPQPIANDYTCVLASFGPSLPFAPDKLTGELILVDDDSANPTLGCEAPFVNANQVKDNIALIDRGTCNFTVKVMNAQDAGAIAVIVCQNDDLGPFAMGGSDPAINIPSVMISKADCEIIKAQLTTGSEVFVDLSATGSNEIDGDFDNGVICHEYGHGVSNRLTGGPDNAGCLNNGEQMGEGWSDFFGLALTTTSKHKSTDARGIGTYVLGQLPNGSGIRNYPYSTDMGINPHTYNSLKESSEVHFVGEVWCAMLWDLYWAFVDKYGFSADIFDPTSGNGIAMQLVMDGMKLQPCSPGFVDGRDAILAADKANYSGLHQCLIWDVFARRGLGYSATQGGSDSTNDGAEAFDAPPTCLPTLKITKTAPATVNAGQEIEYTFEVRNDTENKLSFVTVTDTLASGLTYVPGSCTCGTAATIGNVVVLPSFDLEAKQSITCKIKVSTDPTKFSKAFFADDVELGSDKWTIETPTGNTPWEVVSDKQTSGKNAFFAANPAGQNASESDTYLILKDAVTISGTKPQLQFWHWYNTENAWDGGVVEIQVNNGNWQDLGDKMTQNGYNGVISENPASAISERPAFTGNSGKFVLTIADLSSFVGSAIKLRFRMANDAFEGAVGWWVDDIVLADAHSYFNRACVEANGLKACSEVSTLTQAPATGANNVALPVLPLQLYPNPANSNLNVFFAQGFGQQQAQLTIANIAGQVVMDKNLMPLDNSFEIKIDQLPTGYYTLRLTNNQYVWMQNFAINR